MFGCRSSLLLPLTDDRSGIFGSVLVELEHGRQHLLEQIPVGDHGNLHVGGFAAQAFEITDGLAVGVFAGVLAGHIGRFGLGKGFVHEVGDGDGIMQGDGAAPVLAVAQAEHVVVDAGDETAHGGVGLFHLIHFLGGQSGLAGCVESEHGHGDAGMEDDFGGVGINPDVEFAVLGVVADGGGAAHDDDALDVVFEIGVFHDGDGDVGQGSDGDDFEFAGEFLSFFVHDVPGFHGIVVPFGHGQRVAGHAVAAMDLPCGLQFDDQRAVCPFGDAGFNAQHVGQVQGVAGGVLVFDVAGYRGDGPDVEAGEAVSQHDRVGVVHTGVAVNDDWNLRHGASPPRSARSRLRPYSQRRRTGPHRGPLPRSYGLW